jgi:hypothetical protein
MAEAKKDLKNIAGGAVMIATGVVEAAASGGVCPFCIGVIGGGVSLIAGEFRKKPRGN